MQSITWKTTTTTTTKTGLTENVQVFSVDCNTIDTNVIDIHRYLMKKTRYKVMFALIKKCLLDY